MALLVWLKASVEIIDDHCRRLDAVLRVLRPFCSFSGTENAPARVVARASGVRSSP